MSTAKVSSSSSSSEHLEASNLFDVSHVTAVVTGGGSGIGLMIVQALVSNGAKVYNIERRPDALKTVVDLYDNGPGKIIPIVGDISEKDSVKRLASEIAAKEPNGIQLLVNNAGIARDDATQFKTAGTPDMNDPQAISDHFMKSEPDSWIETFQTNVIGGFFMSMAFLPLLAKGGGCGVKQGYTSSIINISSNSAFLKHSTHGHFAYASSKAAFAHLSRMLATTFAHTGVRVNTIAPGIFPSEMTAGNSGPDQKSQLHSQMPNLAGRPGQESDMAATILFLAGPGGVFYNHQILFPDGGETLILPAAI